MIEVGRFRALFTMVVFICVLSVAAVVLGTWYLLNDIWNLDEVVSLIALGVISLISIAVVSLWLSKLILGPLELVYRALEHVSTSESNTPAPQPEEITFGRNLARTMLQDVYQLASGTREVEATKDKQDDMMTAILGITAIPVFTLDRNKTIRYYNDAAASVIPSTVENVKDHQFEDIIQLQYSSSETLSQWIDKVQANKIKESQIWERIKLETVDGKVRYFDLVATYSKNESHGIETLVALIDHTERYQDDDSNVSFVSLAVHELRAPLTVLRGYIEVFEDELADKLDPDQKEFMHKMSVSAAQLSTFVNNILNVARIENDEMRVHLSQESWVDVLNSASQDFALRAEVRGRHLKLAMPDEMPAVAVDRVSIYEVLSNLIDNAVKYSPENGEIIIRTELKDDNFVETTVQDFGIGIPSQVIGHLFDKYYRSHRSKENIGGTGLGLFLSKSIIEAHGGTIWVKSVEGEGSTFGFTVPTYASVADKLQSSENKVIVQSAHGWIKNHGAVRR